jgi:hypothetical protein
MILLLIFLVSPGIVCFYAMLPDMIDGCASKPFVYRMLLPKAVGIAAAVLPQHLRQYLIRAGREYWRLEIALERLGWHPEYLPEYLIYSILAYSCFLGLAYELQWLIKRFFRFPEAVAEIAPILGLLIVPTFFRYCNYIYDPATLFLFTAALLCIVTGKKQLYYLCFLLATFNKETSCLLIGIFFLWNMRRLPRRIIILHTSVQCFIWALLKAGISLLHHTAPGSLVEFHLIDNTFQLYRMPLRLTGFMIFTGFWSVLIAYGWKEKPPFLRHALFLCLTPLLVLSLFFGFVEETRCYYEAFPFLFLLFLPTFMGIIGYRNASAHKSLWTKRLN